MVRLGVEACPCLVELVAVEERGLFAQSSIGSSAPGGQTLQEPSLISSPEGPAKGHLPARFRIISQWHSLASKAAWMATQGGEQ